MTGLVADVEVVRGAFSLHVHMEVENGLVVAVLGPNGAGKSTLVRALAGLTALDAGRVVLDGEVLDEPARRLHVPADRRPVGVVFQDHRLFPHLSVRENVAFGPRARGQRHGAARQVADELLDGAGLSAYADRRPGQLSGGQSQRVALLRALATRPALLLLDEPLAALDVRHRAEVRAELRRHLAAYDGAAVLVTHDPLDAMVLAERVLVLEDGRAAQQGGPADLARRPATPYVAQLMGLNLYAGRCQAGGVVVLDVGGRLVTAGAPVGEVLVAVRPSAITVGTREPEGTSARNVWPATVTGMELLADRVRVQTAGAPPALVDVTPAAVAELGIVPGGEVWLSLKATDTEAYAAGG